MNASHFTVRHVVYLLAKGIICFIWDGKEQQQEETLCFMNRVKHIIFSILQEQQHKPLAESIKEGWAFFYVSFFSMLKIYCINIASVLGNEMVEKIHRDRGREQKSAKKQQQQKGVLYKFY